ncbi:DUF4371 domain-containing protein, partial [Cephalotus follicularis]
RHFQSSWFRQFSWLEYSPSKDTVFCLPCFLFNNKPTGRFGSNVLTDDGFNNWKKVNCGSNFAILVHMGKDPNSQHNVAQSCYTYLKNQAQHIETVIIRQTSK